MGAAQFDRDAMPYVTGREHWGSLRVLAGHTVVRKQFQHFAFGCRFILISPIKSMLT